MKLTEYFKEAKDWNTKNFKFDNYREITIHKGSSKMAPDYTFKFREASDKLKKHDYSVEFKKVNLSFLRKYLIEKRDFLVRLMENPNLLERESFTDVLLAVFHLTEELEGRKKIKEIAEVDNNHIMGDIKRAYSLLVFEWLGYMKYQKEHYPYMFSHAMRTNPFDTDATIEIKV